MQEKVMNAFAEQTKNLYAPLRKMNALLVENMEKMTEFQLDALKSYSQAGINQIKQANEVRDTESMRDFSTSQAELMSSISKKLLEDAKTMADMSMEFKSEVEKLMEESRSQVFAAKAAEEKAAARSTSSSNKSSSSTTKA